MSKMIYGRPVFEIKLTVEETDMLKRLLSIPADLEVKEENLEIFREELLRSLPKQELLDLYLNGDD